MDKSEVESVSWCKCIQVLSFEDRKTQQQQKMFLWPKSWQRFRKKGDGRTIQSWSHKREKDLGKDFGFFSFEKEERSFGAEPVEAEKRLFERKKKV